LEIFEKAAVQSKILSGIVQNIFTLRNNL